MACSSCICQTQQSTHPPPPFPPRLHAVYAFLYNHTKLNLTALEQATNNDNFVVWIEWREPVKAEAIAYLDDQARVQTAAVKGQHVAARVPKPVRTALAVLIEGRHDPPRVTQVIWFDSWCGCRLSLSSTLYTLCKSQAPLVQAAAAATYACSYIYVWCTEWANADL